MCIDSAADFWGGWGYATGFATPSTGCNPAPTSKPGNSLSQLGHSSVTSCSMLTKIWLSLPRAREPCHRQTAPALLSSYFSVTPAQCNRPATLLVVLCFVSYPKRLHLPDVLVLVVCLKSSALHFSHC